MKTVRVCGPIAKVVREVADIINGPAGPPKAIEGPGVTFLITDEPLTLELIRHEKKHQLQAHVLEPRWIPKWGPLTRLREWVGWLRFYTQYIVEYEKHGYWENRFEIEARQAAGEES